MRGSSASVSGMSDMPVRLMIAAVLTSVALPMMWGAYNDLSVNMTVSGLESESARFLSTVEDVLNGGVGSTLEIELDIRSWGSGQIEDFRIGGSLSNTSDPSRYLIQYHIRGHGRCFLSLDPPVAMGAMLETESVYLEEGTYDLRIMHSKLGDEHVALLEII